MPKKGNKVFREAEGETTGKFAERKGQRSRKSNKIIRMSPMSCILTNALSKQDVRKCLEFSDCSGIL
jgi:hypothetical protein